MILKYALVGSCLAALQLLCPLPGLSQITSHGKQLISSSKADTWVATDALGRKTVMEAQGGKIRKDKFAGIFYFIWQGAHGYDKHGGGRPDEGVMQNLRQIP